ncbi:DUF896 domain-containing protein [Clostridium tyrobutyricum]|uniref:DUF896 domain-containing protein n=1 Tax=Clostridium tyrobutyricum TaxID=1519 RepID=UPI001C38669F|nr:DUF896 domain-containing protein [Clostridium tyrobutyricum]MBV4418132.1 DUF896 domain-containing protein [Clostridium tyrobutyricum]
MIEDKLIDRINSLYAKSKSVGLTEQEKMEQEKLRKKYLNNVKRNFRAQLDNITKPMDNKALD